MIFFPFYSHFVVATPHSYCLPVGLFSPLRRLPRRLIVAFLCCCIFVILLFYPVLGISVFLGCCLTQRRFPPPLPLYPPKAYDKAGPTCGIASSLLSSSSADCHLQNLGFTSSFVVFIVTGFHPLQFSPSRPIDLSLPPSQHTKDAISRVHPEFFSRLLALPSLLSKQDFLLS